MSKKKNKDSEGTKDEKYENLLEFVTSYESRADRLKTALAPLMKTGFLDLVKSVKEGLQNKHTKLNKELTEKQETITSLEEKVAKSERELTCLYQVSSYLGNNKEIKDILPEIAKIVPDGTVQPKDSFVRITFNNEIYTSDNFTDTNFKESARFKSGKKKGKVEIFYRQENAKIEDAFKIKNHQLVNGVSLILQEIVDRKRLQESDTTLPGLQGELDGANKFKSDLVKELKDIYQAPFEEEPTWTQIKSYVIGLENNKKKNLGEIDALKQERDKLIEKKNELIQYKKRNENLEGHLGNFWTKNFGSLIPDGILKMVYKRSLKKYGTILEKSIKLGKDNNELNGKLEASAKYCLKLESDKDEAEKKNDELKNYQSTVVNRLNDYFEDEISEETNADEIDQLLCSLIGDADNFPEVEMENNRLYSQKEKLINLVKDASGDNHELQKKLDALLIDFSKEDESPDSKTAIGPSKMVTQPTPIVEDIIVADAAKPFYVHHSRKIIGGIAALVVGSMVGFGIYYSSEIKDNLTPKNNVTLLNVDYCDGDSSTKYVEHICQQSLNVGHHDSGHSLVVESQKYRVSSKPKKKITVITESKRREAAKKAEEARKLVEAEKARKVAEAAEKARKVAETIKLAEAEKAEAAKKAEETRRRAEAEAKKIAKVDTKKIAGKSKAKVSKKVKGDKKTSKDLKDILEIKSYKAKRNKTDFTVGDTIRYTVIFKRKLVEKATCTPFSKYATASGGFEKPVFLANLSREIHESYTFNLSRHLENSVNDGYSRAMPGIECKYGEQKKSHSSNEIKIKAKEKLDEMIPDAKKKKKSSEFKIVHYKCPETMKQSDYQGCEMKLSAPNEGVATCRYIPTFKNKAHELKIANSQPRHLFSIPVNHNNIQYEDLGFTVDVPSNYDGKSELKVKLNCNFDGEKVSRDATIKILTN